MEFNIPSFEDLENFATEKGVKLKDVCLHLGFERTTIWRWKTESREMQICNLKKIVDYLNSL
jgi:hypothetical protein